MLSAAAAAFFVLPPHISFYIENPGAVAGVLLFILMALSYVILISRIWFAVEGYQELSNRLQFALDATLLGWWQYDPLRRVVSGDTRFREIFDLPADETPIEEIMERVHG